VTRTKDIRKKKVYDCVDYQYRYSIGYKSNEIYYSYAQKFIYFDCVETLPFNPWFAEFPKYNGKHSSVHIE
jgi:hypothetical protein